MDGEKCTILIPPKESKAGYIHATQSDFKARKVTRDKEGHSIILEDVTIPTCMHLTTELCQTIGGKN